MIFGRAWAIPQQKTGATGYASLPPVLKKIQIFHRLKWKNSREDFNYILLPSVKEAMLDT
jgi:hypothetical protein